MRLSLFGRFDLPCRNSGLLGRLVPPRHRRATQAKYVTKAATQYADCGQVAVQLSTHYQAAFGEHLRIVGNLPELGEWNVMDAPNMHWTADHHWITALSLPYGADLSFKVVLLSHSGVVWEPGQDRQLRAEPRPGSSAVTARVAWGIGGIHLAELVTAEDNSIEQSALSVQFDSIWDPTRSGLPSDITQHLETPATEEARGVRQKNVTLEPEWTIFQGDGEPFMPAVPSQNQYKREVAAPIGGDTTAKPAAEVDAISSTTSVAEAMNVANLPAPRTEPKAAQGTGLRKLKKQRPKIDGLQAAGQAAGFAAAGLAAAVVMSALAVDVTDAAIASAVVAAGAALLPASVDSKGRKHAHRGQGGAAPVFSALELGLKAQAMMQAAVSSQEGGSKGAQANKPVLIASDLEIGEAVRNGVEEQSMLGPYIQAKVGEAEEFAALYNPTEEDLFEVSVSFCDKGRAAIGELKNNAVSAKGIPRKVPVAAPVDANADPEL